MIELLETFVVAFFIGLTGALAPGPTLVATIQTSMKGGWSMGPKVTLGHIIIESIVFILIFLGISATAMKFSSIIAAIGGTALIVFGLLTIKESSEVRFNHLEQRPIDNPYIAGFITGISNPYFWIWWLSIGSVLLVSALQGGIALALTFMLGHWTADASWLTFVSIGIHKGRAILSQRGYRWALILCGSFLILFGIYYLVTGILW
jgi:threonine/homoserine/homoserine lactone efflux protein